MSEATAAKMVEKAQGELVEAQANLARRPWSKARKQAVVDAQDYLMVCVEDYQTVCPL